MKVAGRTTESLRHRITLFLQSLTRWWVALLVVVSAVGSLGVIEPATAAGPWKGQVVDKETGKPLEGVVVLAAWYKAYSTQGGWGGAGYYDAEETVTDINAHFTIQAKQTWTMNPFSTIKGPEFFIFKSAMGNGSFKVRINGVKTRWKAKNNESKHGGRL
jgi:hypothetical protein